MNVPAALYAIRWLVRDTFRQAKASGVFWLMLAVSAVCILVCLSVGVSGGPSLDRPPGEKAEFLPSRDVDAKRDRTKTSGVDVVGGQMTFGFGLVRADFGRDARDAVHFLQLLLAGGVADAAGILLALIWTAGFLPSFLEPSSAAVLLAKPAPRWSLLIGKYLGVLVFVAFQALVFVGGTWLVLGLRTGVWDGTYLWAIPMLLFHFAVFFSFSTLIAVCTRSTIACVFGSILFWLLCWGMNFGRHAIVALPESNIMPASFHFLVEAGYWTLPKPADLGILLFDALHAEGSLAKPAEWQIVQNKGAFHPELSVLTSLLFTAVMLGVSAREFSTTDY